MRIAIKLSFKSTFDLKVTVTSAQYVKLVRMGIQRELITLEDDKFQPLLDRFNAAIDTVEFHDGEFEIHSIKPLSPEKRKKKGGGQ